MPHLKPYWCQELTSLNKSMKICRQEWLQSGSPRIGPIFEILKNYRRSFRISHRKAAEKYMFKLYDDIDRAAEIDQEHFWHIVNLKRKSRQAVSGCEIMFNGKLCRDNSSIIKSWKEYFKDFYSTDDNEAFDNNFKEVVDNELAMFHTSPEYRNTRETPVVSLNTVDSILKSVKQNKSPGADKIYEHFIFGEDLFRKVNS